MKYLMVSSGDITIALIPSESRETKLEMTRTTLHVHHAFLYISLSSLHDYDVKVPNFTFSRGGEHRTTTFFFFS